EVRKGDRIIIGHEGVRVTPLERPTQLDVFGFMGAPISSERPHGHLIAGIARRMQALRKSEAKILLAGGPAIIHGGGREPLAWLIDAGYIHVLFCGNALAAHDMEAHLFGTSLGLHLEGGSLAHHGHEHHLRTINRIRAIGTIEEAVRRGVITTGIMAACVRRGVKVVMAGTIRDDGPLPGVIADSVQAQAAMRAALPGVGLALLVASTLERIEPVAGLPDMVFTANAGIVGGRTVVLSQFRYKERRPEETQFERWFESRGYQVKRLPPGLYFEGAGDMLGTRDTWFGGYLQRSDIHAFRYVGEFLGREILPLELVDPRFYQ